MVNEVVFYTKPGCVQCKATVRAFNKQEIAFTAIDVTQDPEAFDYLKAKEIQRMPCVEVRSPDGEVLDSWTGFNPDKISAIAA